MSIKNIAALFFNNIGIRQTVIKNTFWLGFSEVFSRLLEFILIVYIIRTLGIIEFGKFSFALAIASMFLVIFDLGLSDIITRELARDKEAEKDYNALFSLKLVLNTVAFILIFSVSFFITKDPIMRLIIWVLGMFTLITELIAFLYCFVRARQKMEFEAWGKIIRSFILIFFVLFILFEMPSIKNVSYGYLFANLITLVLSLIFFYFKIYPLKLSFNKNIWKKFIKISWPLGLAIIFGTIIVNIDSIIMGYLGQITENGWYNASRKITSLIVMVATFIFMSFYPLLSKLFSESKGKLQRAWNYYLESMIVLAIPILFGGFFLSSPIINFIFGPNFRPSIIVFQILIFMVAISFLVYPYNLMLIVSGQQTKYLWIYLISAVTNVILNIILIPRYSLYGAAIATLITYVILLMLSIEFSRRFTPIVIFSPRLLKVLLISFFASFTMILINRFVFGNINIIFNVLFSILIYFCLLLFFYRLFRPFGSFALKN